MKTLFPSFPLGSWKSGEERGGDNWGLGLGRRSWSKCRAVLMATPHYLQMQRCNLREMNTWILNIRVRFTFLSQLLTLIPRTSHSAMSVGNSQLELPRENYHMTY